MLGTGRKFNITDIVGKENLRKYTEDDFLVIPISITTGFSNTMQSCSGSGLTDGDINYKASTGEVIIKGYTFLLNIDRSVGATSETTYADVNVYLLDNIDIL